MRNTIEPTVSVSDSSTEDHTAETAQGESEVDAANDRHRDEFRPDDCKVGSAIQNRLGEGYEMGSWADDPHQVL